MTANGLLRGFFICILTLTLAATAVAQEDMSSLIKKGQQAADQGEYQKALELFQQVVQQLQEKLSTSMERFFPKPLSGWGVGEIESQSWTGATQEGSHNMSNLTRKYTRKSDQAECVINITNWPMIV